MYFLVMKQKIPSNLKSLSELKQKSLFMLGYIIIIILVTIQLQNTIIQLF